MGDLVVGDLAGRTCGRFAGLEVDLVAAGDAAGSPLPVVSVVVQAVPEDRVGVELGLEVLEVEGEVEDRAVTGCVGREGAPGRRPEIAVAPTTPRPATPAVRRKLRRSVSFSALRSIMCRTVALPNMYFSQDHRYLINGHSKSRHGYETKPLMASGRPTATFYADKKIDAIPRRCLSNPRRLAGAGTLPRQKG